MIVRNYHKEGFGSEKKIAKAFEDDARRLAKDGYIPSQTAAQGPKAASMLLGGLGMIKGGHLTVTYVLSPESKAADAEMQAAFDAFKRDEKCLIAEWQEAVGRWEAECAEIDRAYAASRQPAPALAEPVPAELPAAQPDTNDTAAALDVGGRLPGSTRPTKRPTPRAWRVPFPLGASSSGSRLSQSCGRSAS